MPLIPILTGKKFCSLQIEDFLQDVARGAGQILRHRYPTAKSTRVKTGRGDIVTDVDEESERYIVGRVTRECPDHRILSEESGNLGNANGETLWVIDPLDGTRNYAAGIPLFAVSIGVIRGGVPELGAIYDPIHDEMFFAKRGVGACVNGLPIRVTRESTLDDALVSVSRVRRNSDRTKFVRYVEELSKDTSYFRRFGSAALVMAYVASGRVHAYIQGGLNPWDVAAGVVIIQEAGGLVTDFRGEPIDLRDKEIEIVTSNPVLHSLLLTNVISR